MVDIVAYIFTFGLAFSPFVTKIMSFTFCKHICLQARAGLNYESSYGKVCPNDPILKLQRTTPYYKRNLPPACSFNIRGKCNRGAACPYRHEMHVGGEFPQQNIKDRFYGYVNLPPPSLSLTHTHTNALD